MCCIQQVSDIRCSRTGEGITGQLSHLPLCQPGAGYQGWPGLCRRLPDHSCQAVVQGKSALQPAPVCTRGSGEIKLCSRDADSHTGMFGSFRSPSQTRMLITMSWQVATVGSDWEVALTRQTCLQPLRDTPGSMLSQQQHEFWLKLQLLRVALHFET